MKVAYVTAHFPSAGAGERFLEPEVRALSDYLELTIVPTRPLRLFDFEIYRAATREFFRSPARATRLFTKLAFAPGGLRTRALNILAFPRGLALAQDVRKRELEHIHAIGLAIPSTVAYVASHMTGIEYSIGVHELEIPADGLTSDKLSGARFARTVSSRTCRDLQALVPGAAGQLLVVRAGVRVPERAPDPPLRRVPRVLAAGDDPSELLNAISQLRDRGYAFSCDLIAGRTPVRVERLLQAYDFRGRVRLLREISFDSVSDALARGDYDTFVLASVEQSDTREDMPVLALQAMAAGVATIAVQGASLDEVIDAGSGFLVAPHDPHGMFTVLERLLLDPGLRHRTGQRARLRVLNAFEIDRTTRELARRLGGLPDRPAPQQAALPGGKRTALPGGR
jgi:glycosyltransferase involved in cell wall biosynthesis